LAADYQYGSIDVPTDPEAPVTVTSFPPSADIRAVIGGRGEGLNCSIPGPLEWLMFDRGSGDAPSISLKFRQACVYHDMCYRHGYATYGYSQADCDFALVQQAFRICMQQAGPHDAPRAPDGEYRVTDLAAGCRSQAREVLLGVRIGGAGVQSARRRSMEHALLRERRGAACEVGLPAVCSLRALRSRCLGAACAATGPLRQ
jgi:hypothetical protein